MEMESEQAKERRREEEKGRRAEGKGERVEAQREIAQRVAFVLLLSI